MLGDIVGNAEGGEVAAGHEGLFADLDDIDQLGRIAVQVDDVGRLPRGLGAGVHRHRHVSLGQGRCVIAAVPVMATMKPASWYSRISPSLSSGLAWARKSSTLASAAMSGLSPVVDRLDSHAPQLLEAFLNAGFDNIFQVDYSQDGSIPTDHQRCSPGVGNSIDLFDQVLVRNAPLLIDKGDDGFGRPLRQTTGQ